MANNDIDIWPGSSSFSPGDTPFGFFDGDSQFIMDIDPFAQWSAKKLGHPIQSVELQDKHFYAAYEEAVAKYGSILNQMNAIDDLSDFQGMSTGSVNVTQTASNPTLQGTLRIAKEYGSAAGSGGTLTWYSGSISVSSGKQVYDFLDDSVIEVEKGDLNQDTFTIRKVIHRDKPAHANYVDPSLSSYGAYHQMMREFGWGNMGTPVDFTMMPIHFDLMRVQAIEFHTQIRRSAYSFKLTGNRIRLFPIPKSDFKATFFYTLDAEINTGGAGGDDIISDISNLPYSNLDYNKLNATARMWIRDYAHAISMEMLGMIRNKYSDSYPITQDTSVDLNGSTLITNANEMKNDMVTKLIEHLEKMTRSAQLERKEKESESITNSLSKVPLKFYIR